MSENNDSSFCQLGDEFDDAFLDNCSKNVILSSALSASSSSQDVTPSTSTANEIFAMDGCQGNDLNDNGNFSDLMPTWQQDNFPRLTLVVGEGRDVARLHSNISKVTFEHDVKVTRMGKALEHCHEQQFQLIWIFLSVPVRKDVLNLVKSIRLLSRKNKSTPIMGICDNASLVDLRSSGITEVVTQPLARSTIRHIYSKFTIVQLNKESPDSPPSNKGFQTPSNPATPLTPNTPSTPATPASMSDETDKSSFSISIDSGIESPPNMCQLPDDKMSNLVSIRNIASRTQRHASATDHTTKEKLRRERIKESCDQLRVLLPYIRGRKTDMASILEMCVDYLQIVNAAMPQSLQDQIVDLLSREGGQYVIQAADLGAGKKNATRDVKQLPSPILNMASSLTGPKQSNIESVRNSGSIGTSAVGFAVTALHGVKDENRTRCLTPDFYSRLKKTTPDVNMSPFNAARSVPMTAQISSKRDVTGTLDNMSGAKRLRLNGDVLPSDRPDDVPSQGHVASPNVGVSASFENLASGTSRDDQGTMTYSFYSPQLNQSQTKVYTDMENAFTRMYNVHPTTESFPSGQLFNSFTTSTSKQQLDRDATATTASPYNIFMDNSLYQYYGSSHSGVNSHLYSNPDYVNPNSVLPVSYNNSSRMKSEKEINAEEISANDAEASFPETP